MASWADFLTAAPALAAAVGERFAASLHHVLGTVADDGSPRLSGLEVPIRDGQLWLGMMPGSVKRRDLARDPRFSLHSAPLETDLIAGDAKLSATAVDVSGEESMVSLFLSGTEFDPDGAGGMALFVADLRRITLTRVDADVLRVTTWTPSAGVVEHEVR